MTPKDSTTLTDDQITNILNNTLYTDKDLSPASQALLHNITTNIILTIPPVKFRAFYTKTKEQTSASPSGLHLGHWKAAVASQELSEILGSIINLAIMNSYDLNC